MSENQEDREYTTPTEYNPHEDDSKSFMDHLREEYPDGKEIYRDSAVWWEYAGEDGKIHGIKLYDDVDQLGYEKVVKEEVEKPPDPEAVTEVEHQLLLHVVKDFDSHKEQAAINKFKQSYENRRQNEDKEREYEYAKLELEYILDDKVGRGFAPKGSHWISQRAIQIAQMDPEQRKREMEMLEDDF